MPKVSIIIPTYNRAHLIKQSVQSVLEQSFQDFEIVIVDDGSADNTGQVISDMGRPEKIIYIYQENQGRSKARNKALQISTGRYIAFLDSDDVFLPNKLQVQVDYLDSYPDIGMVYASAACDDEFGNPLGFTYQASAQGHIYQQIAFYIPLTVILPTVMIRREIIERVGHFDENLNRFEDTDYWRRISRICLVGAIPQVLCRIKTHSGNSLVAQNPTILVNDVKKYVNKVLLEDANESSSFLSQGACRLYLHYGSAASGISDPQWSDASKELINLAFRSDAVEYIKLKLFSAFPELTRRLLKRILPDSMFSKLRKFYHFLMYGNKDR
jgi:glycosyltransferase involved in cell wall biosynthesis